jgi:hypothetical protein
MKNLVVVKAKVENEKGELKEVKTITISDKVHNDEKEMEKELKENMVPICSNDNSWRVHNIDKWNVII